MKISIDAETYQKCRKFAEDRLALSANLYKRRGEHNEAKISDDILIGTLGEFGVYKYLTEKGILVSEPDLKIYEKRNKTFASDLRNETLDIAVKSQAPSSIKRYGASWLFQRSDKLVSAPNDRSYIAFTSVDGMVVEILGIVKAVDLLPYYAECKVPMYRGTKVALYLKDFQGKIDLESL